MGMSTYVVGIKPPDKRWQRMKAAWDACEEAGVEIPSDVERFFDWEEPDSQGVVVDIEEACNPHKADGCEGIEVDLTKLDPDITILRFINSW